MKILITGITGMAGSHLAENLCKNVENDVHGTVRWRSNREHLGKFEKRITLHECELKDSIAVMNLIKIIKPDHIYHLASQSSVSASFNAPKETLFNNINAQINIFEAIREQDLLQTKILVAGSSEAYGMVNEDALPIKESTSLNPVSPYGVSKAVQDHLGYQYYKSYGLKIIRTRAFNQTGPRRGDVFVTAEIAKQIAQIEAHLTKPVIYLGNLNVYRDFTDIRDIVRAYILALEKGDLGDVYNIGSDVAYELKDIIHTLINMSHCNISIKKEPSRLRPADIPKSYCDSTKFRKKTGWYPKIELKKSLWDLLETWRFKVWLQCNKNQFRSMYKDGSAKYGIAAVN